MTALRDGNTQVRQAAAEMIGARGRRPRRRSVRS